MNNNLDLISIIIPVYNAEPYLKRCLESVLKQDYPNIEIVLVNDGSTDGSLAICDKYANDYPNIIRVHDQQNTGASLARKHGIEIAIGEYLMFVDSDDYVSPNYASALYYALKGTSANISVCNMKRLKPEEACDFPEPAKECILAQKELFKRFFKYDFWGYGASCYKKTVFENIIFPEATVNEDYYVKAQMFSKEEKIAHIDTSLYFYEQHTGSLSKQPLSLRALGEFDNALATWKYIKASTPQYSRQALAIASEVACKWLGILNIEINLPTEYISYVNNIKKFLRHQFAAIILNPYFLWKLKIVILRNLVRVYR